LSCVAINGPLHIININIYLRFALIYILRRPSNSITRRVLQWNPQGQRRRGRPKNTWRRGVEQEMKKAHLTWDTMETTAQDRGLVAYAAKGLQEHIQRHRHKSNVGIHLPKSSQKAAPFRLTLVMRVF